MVCVHHDSLADSNLAAARAELAKVQEEQQAARDAAAKASEDALEMTTQLKALEAEVEAAAGDKQDRGRQVEALKVGVVVGGGGAGGGAEGEG